MMQREDQQLEKTPTAKVPRVAARPASREDASRPPRGNSSRTQHGNATRAPLQQRFLGFLFGFLHRMRNQDLLYRASSLSYDLLMASIPLLLLFVMLASLFFAHPTNSVYSLLRLLPDAIAKILAEVLAVLTQNVNPGTIGFGLLSAIWLGSNGFNKLILDVNTSLGFRLRGKSLMRRSFAMVYTVLFLTAILLLLVLFVFYRGLMGVADRAIHEFGIRELDVLVRLLRSFLGRALPLCFFLFTLVLFYRTAPLVSHGNITWRESAYGGIVAGIGILLLTGIYGYVLDHVSRLSLYFGSLAGILGLFVWLKYTCLILIIGAETIAVARLRKAKAKGMAMEKGGALEKGGAKKGKAR